MSAPQHDFDLINCALVQVRKHELDWPSRLSENTKLSLISLLCDALSCHVLHYPEDLMYLVRPRHIGTILVRSRTVKPYWSSWVLPAGFVGSWSFKELCEPLVSQKAITVPVSTPPPSPPPPASDSMDPDLDNKVPSSPIADTDPLGYPFPGPHRRSLLAPPPIRSSSPTIIFRAKRKRVSNSSTRATKRHRSNKPRIKSIDPLSSVALPPYMGTRSKGKARGVAREDSPPPPPTPCEPPVTSSTQSTLRPHVRQWLIPMISHMYSHGLDIPTIPSDSCFNVPSASELRQVEAAYTPIDALPGAISAGDLSRLGPIPQVHLRQQFKNR